MKTGAFELDSVDASGPPAKVTISSTSLAFSGSLRQTKKSRAWESCSLHGIASEIAAGGGMGCLYESGTNPSYDRVEQTNQSDIEFLKKLCQDAGISIKATDGKIVLYDQAAYEAKAPVLTIEKGVKGGYTKYKLSSGSADTQYAKCRVRWMDPATGTCIEGTAEDGDVSGEQCLEVKARVASVGEAQTLALKHLRLHNKLAKTVTFAVLSDLARSRGLVVGLKNNSITTAYALERLDAMERSITGMMGSDFLLRNAPANEAECLTKWAYLGWKATPDGMNTEINTELVNAFSAALNGTEGAHD